MREAVVVAREDEPGDKRLVAYYTSTNVSEEEQSSVGAEELRAYLSGKLPEYMVPAAYVRLESSASDGQWEAGSEGVASAGGEASE